MQKEKAVLSDFNQVVYIDYKKVIDNRCLVIFDDYKLDHPKIDYEKMCQHMIDIFTTAIQESQSRKYEDFVILCYLNPKRKNSINLKSVVQMITIMKSLFKDTLNKCVFVNSNKFFKIAFNLILPLLDNKLKRKIKFSTLEEIKLQITNLKE